MANHRDFEFVVGLEPVYDVLKCRVVAELEAVPQRPLRCPVLEFRGGDGFREAKEWEGKIDESILVLFKLGLAINDLEIFSLSVDAVSYGYVVPCTTRDKPTQSPGM